MHLCAPWADSYYHNWKIYQNLDNKTYMNVFWKGLYHSQKMQGINPMGYCAPWDDTYLHNWKPTYLNHQNQLDEIGMIYLKPVNKLMTTSETKKPSPLPQSSTNMWWKQSCISGLDMSHRKFSYTPEDKFQYQWTLIHSMQYTSQQSTK